MKTVEKIIIPGAEGRAFKVKAGQTLMVRDVEGDQISDFIAFNLHDHSKKISISHTRQDSGSGDNTGNLDHVGIVEKVSGDTVCRSMRRKAGLPRQSRS